jgi:LysM repeat protein
MGLAVTLTGCGGGSDQARNPTTTGVKPTVAPVVVSAAPTTLAPPQTYVVASGDTLGAIARMFDVSVEDLASLNDIEDPNRISVGQELRIPGGATSATTTTSAPASG